MWSEKHVRKLCTAFRTMEWGKWIQMDLEIRAISSVIFFLMVFLSVPRNVHLTIQAEAGHCLHTESLDLLVVAVYMSCLVKHCSKNLKGHKHPYFSVSLDSIISMGLSNKIWLSYFSYIAPNCHHFINFPGLKRADERLLAGWEVNKKMSLNIFFPILIVKFEGFWRIWNFEIMS